MATLRRQRGTVLVISLLILLVMTTLGVSAMLGSSLQERMVANQKQAIAASLAAEAGAIRITQWLRAHPEAWDDAAAWRASAGLPLKPSSNAAGNQITYWIESVDVNGSRATVVSRGGLWIAGRIIEQNSVTVGLQSVPDESQPESAQTPTQVNSDSPARLADSSAEPERPQQTAPEKAAPTTTKPLRILFWRVSLGGGAGIAQEAQPPSSRIPALKPAVKTGGSRSDGGD